MIRELRTVQRLIAGKVRGWMTVAIIGSFALAGLDTLGVAAMLPLMQLVTGTDMSTGILQQISVFTGSTNRGELIILIAGAVALAFVVKSLLMIGFRWWLLGKTTGLEAEAATALMRRYVLAPFAVHRGRSVPEIYRNIASSVAQTFLQVVLGLIGLIADILTLIALGVFLVFVSPLAAIFTVIFFSLLGWGFQRIVKRKSTQIGEAIAQSDLDTWRALMPALDGFRVARLYSGAEQFISRFHRAKLDRARTNRELSMISEVPRYILETGFVIGIAAIAALLFATGSPEQALTALGVFAAASTRLMPTLNRVLATLGLIRAGRASLSILAGEIDVLDRTDLHSEKNGSRETYTGNVVLRSVSFCYSDATVPVLQNVSTTIERGKTTAFVGSSGAGKSTLLDIIMGLLPPTSGAVTCGGKNVFDDLASWYCTLGVVPQDVYILDDTLANNIAFGQKAESIDRKRLTETIKLAQLESLVLDLSNGLETQLGERGVRLSGGQRQRVGIARALYRNPEVLILDEATSSLDNATEAKISATIESLSGHMTIVLVAHRLSTVRTADKVVFMSQGMIAAEGTFDEVGKSSAEFAELVSLGQLL